MRGLKRQYTIHLGRQCTLALSGWRRQNGPGTAHLEVTNRPAQLQTGRPFRAHSPRRTRSMRDTARRGSRSVRPRESVRYVRSHAPRTCSSNRSASVCHPGPRLHSNAPGGSGALITRLLDVCPSGRSCPGEKVWPGSWEPRTSRVEVRVPAGAGPQPPEERAFPGEDAPQPAVEEQSLAPSRCTGEPRAGEGGERVRRGAGGAGEGAGHPRSPPSVSRRLCLAGAQEFFDFRCFACGIPKSALDIPGVLFSFWSLLLV